MSLCIINQKHARKLCHDLVLANIKIIKCKYLTLFSIVILQIVDEVTKTEFILTMQCLLSENILQISCGI